MIRFGNQSLFILYWLLPLLVLFYWYAFKKKNDAAKSFGSEELMKKLMSGTSRTKQKIKSSLLVFGAVILIFTLTRPQIGTRLEEVTREGQDILIAIDVSKSMLAEDILPSRLEKAKFEVGKIIEKLQGDRIGLIAFAGEPFVQCPLTLDYSAARLLLSVINPDLIPVPGTDITKAIKKAIETFEQKERKYKVLILITDGENHSEEVEKAAEDAAKEGIVIYCVGIGTPDGVPIPDFDENGIRRGYKKDDKGNTIVSKLDEFTLEKIALSTNGKYYNATPEAAELDLIYEAISEGEKKQLGSLKFTQYEDRFQIFLALFLVILIIEMLLSEKRKVKKEWTGRFN